MVNFGLCGFVHIIVVVVVVVEGKSDDEVETTTVEAGVPGPTAKIMFCIRDTFLCHEKL